MRPRYFLFITLFLFLSNPPSSFSIVEADLANVLKNPSFEDQIGGANNWDNTPGRGISTSTAGGAADGVRFLSLNETLVTTGQCFTFQTVSNSGVGEGDFVSLSAFVRLTGADGNNVNNLDLAQIQIKFNDASGRQISTVNSGTEIENALDVVPLQGFFTQFTVSATAPRGTRDIVFTLLIDTPDASGTVAEFDKVTGTISKFPISLDTSASKSKVPKGGAAFLSSRIKNVSSSPMNNLEFVAQIPEGFTFIGSGSRLDETPVNAREGSKIFTLGSIASGENKHLGFLLAASSAVQIGKKYEVSFFVRDTAGTVRSAARRVILTIEADPLFDEGTILGKVFDDQNENAVQDEGEKGIAGVRLATEEGIVVIADARGRFHIPAVKPGRHVVKIDGHTLPQASKFVTEESVLVKTTEGIMNVVNFAVKLPASRIPEEYRKQLDVMVTQGNDFSEPELAVSMEPRVLRMGLGFFEKDPVISTRTNYAELIAGWRIEIKDEFGDEIWTGYGLGQPPKEVSWEGKTKDREPARAGVYSYRLIVRDRQSREDWTPLQYFRVVSKMDRHVSDEPRIDVPAAGNMSMNRDGKRSIPIAARPKLSVRGGTVPWNTVTVNGESAAVNADGSFQTELFVPPGEQTVLVTTTDREGNSVSYHENVNVKDSVFFMVGLGEEELGANLFDGNVEVTGREDKFHHDFYQDGRAAYYLKGKIKGRFLVESRYDTDDPRGELFTNLDPDLYYPVYGDDSSIRYDAYDTKQRFYILIEMDRSYLKWGSFHTNFTDTELASHNRTFSGLKIHYQTLSTTRYGDPKRGFVVYTADVDQLADHNEFAGTGGSLFYLRNKNVIQGSEKIRVEVRDSIQEITISSRDLAFGTDYEIDYDEGRLILRKPLSAVSYSDTIIYNDILNGSDTYLIVDYEFDAQGFVQDRNNGIRGFTHIGDHLRIGGTAIEDRRPTRDYDLRGIDAVAKLGRNTKVTAEYALSQARTLRNGISFNGGITFTDLPTGAKVIKKTTQRFDDAYLIKGETKLKTRTEVTGYAQQIAAGFSNADLIRQAGARKSGLEIRQKAGEHAQFLYRFDRQKATDPDNTANLFVTSPEESRNHTAQFKIDIDNVLAVTEYRSQNVDPYTLRERDLTTSLDDVQFGNALAGKLGYRMENGWMPYGKTQITWGGKREPNHQFGGGIEAAVLQGKGTVRFEELVGEIGDSTLLGFDVKTQDASNVYTTLRTGPDLEGPGRAVSTTIGSSSQVNSKSRFYSEREFSSYRAGERAASILGYDTKLTKRLGADFSFERSQIRDITEINAHRNAGALELKYVDRDALKVISRCELRYEGNSEDRIHWLLRDTVDWKLSEDYRFSARFNRSDVKRFSSRTFRTDASFTEFNMGAAYRPVKHNRLNVLTRYTWLQDIGAQSQFDTPDIFGIQVDESAHILGIEFGYEVLPPWLGLVEKLAYRRTSLHVDDDTFYIGNVLWVSRLNFHVVRKWDLALEYRILRDFELLEGLKHGALAEVDREIMEYVRFGMGYNFTDFDDDLRKLNSFSNHGFFARFSGKI